jgi:dihydrofolate reductase
LLSKVRVASFSLSLDGFGAGPNQSLDHPLGENGQELHRWFFATRTFRAMNGADGGETGTVDDTFAARGFENVGAWILGRNMFAPTRGAWDESWRGWWGPSPPYHVPVFVLTHHTRAPLEMEGGTTFHFITDGIEAALERARGFGDVRIGGGVATIQQLVRARLIDELHVAFSPVLLGAGESMFAGVSFRERGYRVVESVAGERATHVRIERSL